MFESQIKVGNGLSFYTLRGVNDQERPITGSQSTGNFISKVDMTRCINQMEMIDFTILGFIIQSDRLRFNGNTALTFQIHAIQNLFDHITRRDRPGMLQQPVSQCGLSMINMGYDAKIADVGLLHRGTSITT